MKRVILVLITLLLTLPTLAALAAIAARIPAPKVVKINERIHALLGPMELPNKGNQGYMVNATLILGDSGAILVDTGFTDEIGAHLAKAVAKITPKPVTHIINTHHHGDHTFGNSAFPNAKVLSSEACRKLLIESEADWHALIEGAVGRKFPNTRAVPATEVYARSTRSEIVIDGVKMVIWVPQAAHTSGDLLIWLPDDRVLVAGDVLVNQVTPNFRDATMKDWIATLAEIQTFPAKTLIPGHGPLMTLKDASAMHERMAKLYAGIEEGYKAGLTDSEVRKRLDLSEWRKLRHFNEIMGGNINKAYLEAEAAAF